MSGIGAGLSTDPSAAAATREAAARAAAGLGGAPVDLAFVFLSPVHLPDVEAAVTALREELAPAHVLGCVADGVVAGARELERGAAVAVWAASFPGATIETFHAVAVDVGDAVAIGGLPELDDPDLVALLVDPFTFPTGALLDRLGEDLDDLPIVGGIASGAGAPGAQALVVEGEVVNEGAVGAVLSGLPVRPVVSQGCAPIGRDAVITRADQNLVYELAGEPALDRLREELGALPPDQQLLAARGLLVGLVIDENKPEYERGDFLVRGLLGIDEDTGAIALGETVRVGQTLRFQVRDATSADEDLRHALDAALAGGGRPAGALLFTCNGRGLHMFGEPDHDARLVTEALGTDALAGFFCGGEIGPVGGRPFLHGFTATMALFYSEEDAARPPPQ